MELSDKVLIVTGATGNLGRAVAERAHAAGASVVLVGRSLGSLEKAYPDAGSNGTMLPAAAADLGDPASCASVAAAAEERFGRVDGLLNTVGGFAYEPFADGDWAGVEAMIRINLASAYAMTKAVLPGMAARGSGRIVHVGAGAAVKAPAGLSAYAASKSAVMRMVEALAEETRNQGVTVNCVLPGIIDTPQNRAAMPDADPSGWTSPEAIADAMLFFATDAARAVTGALLPVTGRG